MDDLSAKLSQLLNDPESLNRVREMAKTLFSNTQTPTESQSEAAPDTGGLSDLLGGVDIGTLTTVLSKLNHNGGDDRVRLITALRPHLSEKRRQRADTAIQLLKLIDLLPLLKESGLLHW